MHWTQTPAGKRKMTKIRKAAWAKRKNGDSGDGKKANGATLVSVEVLNGSGKVEKIYLRRKDDPKPAAVMARAAHA